MTQGVRDPQVPRQDYTILWLSSKPGEIVWASCNSQSSGMNAGPIWVSDTRYLDLAVVSYMYRFEAAWSAVMGSAYGGLT